MTKPGWEALAGVMALVSAVLADAPGWVIVGVFLFCVVHRILPRDSSDLLKLWLQMLPCRDRVDDPTEDGGST